LAAVQVQKPQQREPVDKVKVQVIAVDQVPAEETLEEEEDVQVLTQ
jgi:hypothetical protein